MKIMHIITPIKQKFHVGEYGNGRQRKSLMIIVVYSEINNVYSKKNIKQTVLPKKKILKCLRLISYLLRNK